MRVLLISTYELGHQPLHVASPAGALQRAGHEVRCLDLSVQPWDQDALAWAQAVGFSVPMHTAMRLALSAARRIRGEYPRLPICLYGLYAAVSRELVIGEFADRVIAGEYEPGLVSWIDSLTRPDTVPSASEQPIIQLARGTFELPARDLLPGLQHYARLAVGGEERLVGYVEASHGCVHRCRHCPVPAVYDGRIRIVQADTVLRDIECLVGMGAAHITFGDPDFLNGKRHSLAIVRELHERFPTLTFDVTTKVEHVLEHADVWPEMASSGCLFVVSALESVNDEILTRLDKGHNPLRRCSRSRCCASTRSRSGPRSCPSLPGQRPVTCSTSSSSSPPRTWSPTSTRSSTRSGCWSRKGRCCWREHLGRYDADRLSYPWRSADPSADHLQGVLSALVQQSLAAQQPIGAVFARIRAEVRKAAGEPSGKVLEDDAIAVGSTEGRPRLTEAWFCCAEPTEEHFGTLQT